MASGADERAYGQLVRRATRDPVASFSRPFKPALVSLPWMRARPWTLLTLLLRRAAKAGVASWLAAPFHQEQESGPAPAFELALTPDGRMACVPDVTEYLESLVRAL